MSRPGRADHAEAARVGLGHRELAAILRRRPLVQQHRAEQPEREVDRRRGPARTAGSGTAPSTAGSRRPGDRVGLRPEIQLRREHRDRDEQQRAVAAAAACRPRRCAAPPGPTGRRVMCCSISSARHAAATARCRTGSRSASDGIDLRRAAGRRRSPPTTSPAHGDRPSPRCCRRPMPAVSIVVRALVVIVI